MKAVLLIVDVQTLMMEAKPYQGEALIRNIQVLLEKAREKGIECVYVQHDGAEGSGMEPFSPGWEINRAIAPLSDEKVFRKRYNSAFKETGLDAYLKG
ncbi:MAG: isochorismatase family protein, partial [Clostridia bacterium]|nr:isochorismatase family protein [Clostridia bacterium]